MICFGRKPHARNGGGGLTPFGEEEFGRDFLGSENGKKIYLVYDFEELCGVFSNLANAKKAVAEHLALVRKYTEQKAKKMEFGEVSFEVFEDEGEKRWIFALLAKTKRDGMDLHRRKVVIYQYNMDQYYSMLKRYTRNYAGLELSDGLGGNKAKRL